MLDTEEVIPACVRNEAGTLATTEALKQFDTDGTPFRSAIRGWISKGQSPRPTRLPTGEVVVECHVYQTLAGGATFCPRKRDVCIIITSTPCFSPCRSVWAMRISRRSRGR